MLHDSFWTFKKSLSSYYKKLPKFGAVINSLYADDARLYPLVSLLEKNDLK